MPYRWFPVVFKDDLDNVEPHSNLRVANAPQVIKSSHAEPTPFFLVNSLCRPCPILGRPGFHLDKHKTIAIAEYHVDFAAGRSVIGNEKFEPAFLEVLSRNQFTPPTQSQMRWQRPRLKEGQNPFPETHGTGELGPTAARPGSL